MFLRRSARDASDRCLCIQIVGQVEYETVHQCTGDREMDMLGLPNAHDLNVSSNFWMNLRRCPELFLDSIDDCFETAERRITNTTGGVVG